MHTLSLKVNLAQSSFTTSLNDIILSPKSVTLSLTVSPRHSPGGPQSPSASEGAWSSQQGRHCSVGSGRGPQLPTDLDRIERQGHSGTCNELWLWQLQVIIVDDCLNLVCGDYGGWSFGLRLWQFRGLFGPRLWRSRGLFGPRLYVAITGMIIKTHMTITHAHSNTHHTYTYMCTPHIRTRG